MKGFHVELGASVLITDWLAVQATVPIRRYSIALDAPDERNARVPWGDGHVFRPDCRHRRDDQIAAHLPLRPGRGRCVRRTAPRAHHHDAADREQQAAGGWRVADGATACRPCRRFRASRPFRRLSRSSAPPPVPPRAGAAAGRASGAGRAAAAGEDESTAAPAPLSRPPRSV